VPWLRGAFAIGGGKVTQIPVLDIRDWRMVRRDAQHAVFRPSMKTFGRRLGWTLLCAVLAGLSYFSLREYLDTAMVPMEDTQALGSLVADTNWMLESMRRGMSPEEWSRLKGGSGAEQGGGGSSAGGRPRAAGGGQSLVQARVDGLRYRPGSGLECCRR
jgi:hypothetical protein